MRRTIGVVTGTLVIGATAVVVLASGGISMAEAPTASVELKPPTGQTAVSNETPGETDVVTFGGQVTPSNAVEVSASIRFEAANGERCRGFGPGRAQDLNVGVQLSWEGTGQISGSRQLPGMGPDAEFPTCHGGHIILTVVARDPGPGGQDTTAKSAPVPIDLVGPVFQEARLTATDTVKVLFSEPVHLKSQPDSPADWEVNGLPAVGISGTGAERTLTIAPDQDEDATPSVNYMGPTRKIEGRETYLDSSANNGYAGQDDQGGSSFQTARDFVAPRIPTVDSVAGKAGNSAVANDPTPEIVISDIRSGHWAEIYREANGQPGLQHPGDGFLGEDQADGTGARVVTNDLGSDGSYTLYAIARDNALCDPPDDSAIEAQCPNWSGANAGSTVSYVLDRVAPAPLFAAVTDLNEVTVGFTEDVIGTNNSLNWRINGVPASSISGSGDRRTLTATGAAPGAILTYTPGNHADEAGNALPAFTTSLLDQLPPLVEFTDPAFDTYVQGTTYAMSGTADRSNQVQIFRDDDGNGTPDSSSPIATAPVSGDSWSANVPLNADTTNRFVARGVRTDTTPNIQGPNVRLDAALVQDSKNPTLSLGQFLAAYKGEFQVDISWDAEDGPPNNFGSGPMTLEFSPDGGTTWELIQPFYPDDSPYQEWVTPLINTKNAQIRVTATDLAGRSTAATSNAFEIDSLPPLFLARMLDARRVLLDFTEGVNGLFAALEWKIGNDQAGEIDPAGPNSGITRATLTAGPLAPDMDPSNPPKVSYGSVNPLPETTELVDHVGWPLTEGNRVAPSQPPPGPGESSSGAVCTIIGTDGADSLFGTDGPDVICPLAGNDKIEAFGGDDIIVTGPGRKVIDGGAGNDEINGGPEADILMGGPGNDVIFGYGGDDQIDGSDGDDVLYGDDGADSLKGGPGVDILEGNGGNDHLSGGAGEDYLEGSNGNDSLGGGDGDDRLNGHGGQDALRGDAGDDILNGGDGADTVDGGDGNDLVLGTAGADKLFGSDGNDTLKGGPDNDLMKGGKGRDVLLGQSGRDKLAGAGGRDRLLGGSGRDQLGGGKGRDFCSGGGGRDVKRSCERGPQT